MNAGEMMADKNVAQELSDIRGKLVLHDQLHQDNSQTLIEVKNVLVGQAKLSERFISLDRRFEKLEASHDKQFEKIGIRLDKNQKTILQWSGGITAIFALLGALGVLSKFFI